MNDRYISLIKNNERSEKKTDQHIALMRIRWQLLEPLVLQSTIMQIINCKRKEKEKLPIKQLTISNNKCRQLVFTSCCLYLFVGVFIRCCSHRAIV